MSQCLDDAEIAASSTKNPEFLLELVFSAKCQAGWARVIRRDGNALANQIEVEIYRRSDPAGTSRQKATEADVQAAFTTMIVRTDPSDRLCATGAILTGGNRLGAVEPVCS